MPAQLSAGAAVQPVERHVRQAPGKDERARNVAALDDPHLAAFLGGQPQRGAERFPLLTRQPVNVKPAMKGRSHDSHFIPRTAN